MGNYKTVPNQKVIVMPPKGERIRDKQHTYGMFSIDEAQKVAFECGSSAFVLYMYLQKNQDGYEFALSREDVSNWGLGKTAYSNAVDTLINAGYLVRKEEGSNKYYFHESPRGYATQPRKNDNNSRGNATIPPVVMPHNHAWVDDNTTRGIATQPEIIHNTKIKNNTDVCSAAQSAAPSAAPVGSVGGFFEKMESGSVRKSPYQLRQQMDNEWKNQKCKQDALLLVDEWWNAVIAQLIDMYGAEYQESGYYSDKIEYRNQITDKINNYTFSR